MIVPAAVLLCTMTIFVPPVMADMSPKEILAKADEARGNAEGMEWEIDIASIEGGRQQERVIKSDGAHLQFPCRIPGAREREGPEGTDARPEHVVRETRGSPRRSPSRPGRN